MDGEVTYVLLPDSREYQETAVALTNVQIRALSNVSGAQYHSPFHPVRMRGPQAWSSTGAGIEPDRMLSILKGIDWVHPAKLLYRAEGENTWSFVTLGLSSPELGEGDE